MKILYIDCFRGFDASMLLGAVIDSAEDAQAICRELAGSIGNITITSKRVERLGIECTSAGVIAAATPDPVWTRTEDLYPKDADTDAITMHCAARAIELMGADYVICSDIRIKDGTDGEVIRILDSAGFACISADEDTPYITPVSAHFLTMICKETGPLPQMDIEAVGYGAGADESKILTVYWGEFGCGYLGADAEEEVILI